MWEQYFILWDDICEDILSKGKKYIGQWNILGHQCTVGRRDLLTVGVCTI